MKKNILPISLNHGYLQFKKQEFATDDASSTYKEMLGVSLDIYNYNKEERLKEIREKELKKYDIEVLAQNIDLDEALSSICPPGDGDCESFLDEPINKLKKLTEERIIEAKQHKSRQRMKIKSAERRLNELTAKYKKERERKANKKTDQNQNKKIKEIKEKGTKKHQIQKPKRSRKKSTLSKKKPKRIRSSSSEQVGCCVLGCENQVTNRLRYSLRCLTANDFKPGHIEKNWNKVCHYHYFSDLYKYKKMKNANKQ